MTNPCLQTACDALGWKLLEPIKGGRPRINLGWGAFEIGHPALVGSMLEAIRAKRRIELECDDDGVTVWIPALARSFHNTQLHEAVLAAFLEVGE